MDPQTRAGGEGSSPTFLAIVRRGDEKLYGTLQRQFEGEAEVHVMWDRRRAERRARGAPVGPDRRGGDRRGLPPASWDLGIVFVTARAGTFGTGRPPRPDEP